MEQFVVHLKEKKMALKVGLFSRFVWEELLKEPLQGKAMIVTYKYVMSVANESGVWKLDIENLSQRLQ
jgi:hypothetical protein